MGRATFSGARRLTVSAPDGVRELEASRLFVDTGSLPSLPPIPGANSPRVHVSSTLINVRTLPHRLVVIGGGFVGLEFASMYADFGAQVTVLQRGPAILKHEDPDAAQAVRDSPAKPGHHRFVQRRRCAHRRRAKPGLGDRPHRRTRDAAFPRTPC